VAEKRRRKARCASPASFPRRWRSPGRGKVPAAAARFASGGLRAEEEEEPPRAPIYRQPSGNRRTTARLPGPGRIGCGQKLCGPICGRVFRPHAGSQKFKRLHPIGCASQRRNRGDAVFGQNALEYPVDPEKTGVRGMSTQRPGLHGFCAEVSCQVSREILRQDCGVCDSVKGFLS